MRTIAPPPATGCTLADAMVHFAPAETKVLAQHWKRCCQLIALAGPDQGIPDEVMRCVFEQTEPLCDRLKAKLLAGEACLIGFRKGDHEHVRPDAHWCTAALLNPLSDTATAAGLELVDVRIVLTAAPSAAPRTSNPPRKDYRKSDAELVTEGISGIASGIYKDATDTSRQLAKRAQGAGTEESKAARLARRIRSALSERNE